MFHLCGRPRSQLLLNRDATQDAPSVNPTLETRSRVLSPLDRSVAPNSDVVGCQIARCCVLIDLCVCKFCRECDDPGDHDSPRDADQHGETIMTSSQPQLQQMLITSLEIEKEKCLLWQEMNAPCPRTADFHLRALAVVFLGRFQGSGQYPHPPAAQMIAGQFFPVGEGDWRWGGFWVRPPLCFGQTSGAFLCSFNS